jgi:hypothetical protein
MQQRTTSVPLHQMMVATSSGSQGAVREQPGEHPTVRPALPGKSLRLALHQRYPALCFYNRQLSP